MAQILFGKDTLAYNLDRVSKMDADELLEKYRIVKYSAKDVVEINACINKIRGILEKYNKKLDSRVTPR